MVSAKSAGFKISKLTLIGGVVTMVGLFFVLGIILVRFGQKYQKNITVDSGAPRQFENQKTFYIKKITVKKDGHTYEFNANGQTTKYETEAGSQISRRKVFSFEQIQSLFNTLTKEEFESLLAHYFGDSSYSINIDTTHGSKTIIVDNQGETPPPGPLDEIIDEIDDLIDDVDEPDPTPTPTAEPTPTPTPTPTLAPTPTSTPTPTPNPTPFSTPAPADPFSCTMLNGQINDVTVSNTVCEKPQ